MKVLIVLSLLVGGCTIPGVGFTEAPAPLQKTVIDDVALKALWQTFDVALDGINLLRTNGVLVAGTPRALRVADAIDAASLSLQAAEHAAKAGSTLSYGKALGEALAAMADLRMALKGQ